MQTILIWKLNLSKINAQWQDKKRQEVKFSIFMGNIAVTLPAWCTENNG